MSRLMIIVGIILVLFTLIGCCKGLIKIAASLGVTIATIALVLFLSPYVSSALQKATPIEKHVQKYCENLLGEQAEQKEQELSREEQIEVIKQAQLPNILENVVLDNNNKEVYESLGVTAFRDYICKYMTKIITDILAFLITFILVTIVVRIVLYIAGILTDLPVLGGINRLAGGIVGLAFGLCIVWLFFAGITICYQTPTGMSLLKEIQESPFLNFLYEKNLIMELLLKWLTKA